MALWQELLFLVNVPDVLFYVLFKRRLDLYKSFINVFFVFSACQHNLAGAEDEQTDLGVHHVVYESRKGFWVIGAEIFVHSIRQLLKHYVVLNRAGSDHVLHFKVCEFNRVAYLSYCLRVVSRCFIALTFILCSCNNHFSVLEN